MQIILNEWMNWKNGKCAHQPGRYHCPKKFQDFWLFLTVILGSTVCGGDPVIIHLIQIFKQLLRTTSSNICENSNLFANILDASLLTMISDNLDNVGVKICRGSGIPVVTGGFELLQFSCM